MIGEEEFLKTIHENQALIHKVCNIYRNNKEDKEDLFQEITYQLWKSYPKFQGRSKITTWMYRISLNTAMASFRKQKVVITEVKEFPEPKLEEKETNLQREQLLYAIRKLDDSEKAIISLFLDNMSNSEISEIIGISKNNVSVRLNRIKNKLKNILK